MSNLTGETSPATQSMTATEQTLAAIWRDLLGVSDIDATDDFFKLGGNSLAAIKLLQRVETAFGPDTLFPETLYADGRLASVAKAIDEAADETTDQATGK